MGEPGEERQRRAAPTGGAGAGSVLDELNQYQMMEDVYEKLKLLSYHSLFLAQHSDFKPLSRLYFALPTKANEQFTYFSSLFAFLSSLLSMDIIEWNEFDDPATISSAILQQTKSMGLTIDFPATRLRTGSGEAVVYILDFMTKKCLEAKRFTVAAPVYPSPANGSSNEEVETIDEDEDEDQSEDKTADETVEEETHTEITPRESHTLSSIANSLSSSSSTSSSFLTPLPSPSSDPTAWLLEVERQAPHLRLKPTHLAGAREWRGHYDTSKQQEMALTSVLPLVHPHLEKSSVNLNKIIERIQNKEKYLNAEYEEIGNEMREKQTEYQEKQQIYTSKQQQIAESTALLKQKTQQLETLRNQINHKNENMSDSTPVRKVTLAVKKLKEEVNEMEVRIGLLSQSLSGVRMRKQREKSKKVGREEKERREKGNGKIGNIKQKLDQDMEL